MNAIYPVVLLATAQFASFAGESSTASTQISMPVTDWATVSNAFHTCDHSTTNLPVRTDWATIPTNIFVTDAEGWMSGFGPSGRVIDTRQLLKALSSVESKPAEQYPEGNWGEPVGGLQLSIRFAERVFTNGEPVAAIVLLRNVSGRMVEWPLRYIENFAFSVMGPDGKGRPNPERDPRILGPGYYRFERNSQKRVEVRLDTKFSFREPGRYTIQVSTETSPPRREPLSYPVVSSGKAVIEVAKP